MSRPGNRPRQVSILVRVEIPGAKHRPARRSRAEVAQHGIARRDLRLIPGAGSANNARQRRLATGELTRVERGWYTRDQADTDEDRWLQHLAARTARYPDGRLAGQGAAALVGLDGFDPGSPPTISNSPSAPACSPPFPARRKQRGG